MGATLGALALVAAAWGPAVPTQIESDGLADSNPRARRATIASMAESAREAGDSEEAAAAWQLIVQKGLRDLEPQVADEAQLQLGQGELRAARLEVLDSKVGLRSRDELVRLRCVEALGRLGGDLPLEIFTRPLGDKDPEVRAAAAYAIRRRMNAGPWPSLESKDSPARNEVLRTAMKLAKRDRDPMARACCVELACSFPGTALDHGDEIVAIARAALDSGEPLPMAAAVRGLGRLLSGEDLVAALGSSAPGVFMAAMEELEQRGNKAAMQLAAQQVGGERSSAETERAVRTLQRASGLSHGAAPERWQRWADGLAKDWRSKRGEADQEPANDPSEGRSTALFGLRIASEQLVVLVDMSGSMWKENDGASRKSAVEVELAKALRGLPESAAFNVVPYATDPAPWKKKLVPASPKNVEAAIKAFERTNLRGRGDVWSALIPVLRDPNVDTVVILSDGAPSGGIHWNVELMRHLLAAENRYRGVVIHTLLFDASKGLVGRWAEISRDSGGQCVTIQ